ncbi:LacI family DNA-binding transcriptional regulator [Hathewaya massiliensis]|uniref:LacI family DNA-binding transcriptional regulator n=1 Tax=Hathewaya massiliensis TaxID=1964382 RepID=UPI001157DD96|nr:LacI family DNA-binding transcriptional regulator [Hathewaya massiliensis]
MPVTINDVAKEAGVSITTVSRVLNNNYPVKKETRERIEEAIEKLNYRPNIMARGLITKRTSVIGVVVPGITNLFFSTIVESIENAIKQFDYSISLCNTGGDSKEEKNLIEDIISRQVDGIIVIDPSLDNLESGYYEEISKDIPIIIVNGLCESNSCNSVCYDEKKGTLDAFKYLLDLKHRDILFIRGNKSLSYNIKEEVYKDIVSEHKLDYCEILNVGDGNSIQVVHQTEIEFENLLKSTKRPTAVFACNDLMAIGVLNICAKLGISVPEDLSIIGFDNTLLSSVTRPRLTSVDQNMKLVAIEAARFLMDMINQKNKRTVKLNLPTKLILRESCAENLR